MTYLFTCLIVSDRFTAVNLSLSYIYNSIFIILNILSNLSVSQVYICRYIQYVSQCVYFVIPSYDVSLSASNNKSMFYVRFYVYLSICLFVFMFSVRLYVYMSI